jgi:hypothetical protein
MTLRFDILQVDTQGMLWIEAAPSLEEARARVEELVPRTRRDYIIFDQRTADRVLIKFDAMGEVSGK